MKYWFHIVLSIAVIISSGCKSTKTVASDPSSNLPYAKKKQFDKLFFAASKQKVLGNEEKATELYTKALEANPTSHATMYLLTKLLYASEDYNNAMSMAEKTVLASPTYNRWYYGQLAQFYSKFGKYSQSASVFEQMIDNEPDTRKFYIEAAGQYFNGKEYDKAEKLLLKMQAEFGVEEESSTRLEYLYSATKQDVKAVAQMETLANKYPDNLSYKGYLSETYMASGEEEKAVSLLEDIVAANPNSGKAYFSLYTIHGKAGRDRLATENLKMAFKFDDLDLSQKLQSVSIYFLKIKKDEQTKADLFSLSDTLLKYYPDSPEPYMLRSDILGVLGNDKEALKYVKQGVQRDKSDFKLWSKLFSLNAKVGDVEGQIDDLQEALEFFPSIVGLYTSLGYAFLENENYSKAESTAEDGLELAINETDRLDLLSCLASTYGKQKKFDKADKTFDDILKIKPYDALVLNNYAFSLAERGVNIDRADTMVSLALKLEPSNPYYLDTRAWVLYKQGKFENALKVLNKCMLIDPNNIEYLQHAKAIYSSLGNTTMVNEIEDRIKKLDVKQ